MCDFASIAQTTLSAAGNLLGQKAQAKAAQAQMNAQKTAAIRNMNYAFQNFEQERTDAFDAAVAQLDKNAHNAMQLNSEVNNTINENVSGNTARLLERNAVGDTLRTKSSIKDNYDRKSNEIDLNKESQLLSTKDYIKNLNASAPKMPSALTNLVSTAATGVGAYTDYQNRRQLRINATGKP